MAGLSVPAIYYSQYSILPYGGFRCRISSEHERLEDKDNDCQDMARLRSA